MAICARSRNHLGPLALFGARHEEGLGAGRARAQLTQAHRHAEVEPAHLRSMSARESVQARKLFGLGGWFR